MEREQRIAEITNRLSEIQARNCEISKSLETRDAENTTDEELVEIKEEVAALDNEKKELEAEKEKLDEIGKVAEEIATGEINATKVEKEEERKMENKENTLLEERGAALKNGEKITVAFDEMRSTTVAGGTLLVEKKYKREIDPAFNQVSGLIDDVNAIGLDGGESYSVPFEKSIGTGDYTAEGNDYTTADPTFDYVETGRAKVTAYAEISKEVTKLPNANYQAKVIDDVRKAIRRKVSNQIVAGSGDTNTIKGIYNADTKVLPTSTGTADITLEEIDQDTLNKLVFSYGGDETIEGVASIILNKKDLEAFAKVKTSDDRFVYRITRNGQRGTIAYAQGGLEVPFVINSACNAISNDNVAAGSYTLIYGALSSYEMPIFSELEIEESKDAQFKKGMICYRGDVIVGGTVAKYNGFVRVKKGTPSL